MRSPQRRLPQLDLLRFVVVVLVVLFHGAITFMDHAPPWWYVLNARRSGVFTVFVVIADTFLMPVLFGLSGYFAGTQPPTWRWVIERGKRIGLPWAIGTLLFAPALTYTALLSRGGGRGYWDFVSGAYLGPSFSQGHFWYLGVLLTFLLVSAGVRGIAGHFSLGLPGGPNSRIGLVMAVAAGAVAGISVGLVWAPVDAWAHWGYVWEFQPARILEYAAMFWGGTVARRQGWFSAEALPPRVLWWLLALAPATLLWLVVKSRLPDPAAGVEGLLYGVTNVACAFTWGGALLAGCSRWAASRLAPSAGVTRTAYGVYVLHHPIQLYWALFVVEIDLPLALKWCILSGTTLVLSWLGAVLLGRLPGTRNVFG